MAETGVGAAIVRLIVNPSAITLGAGLTAQLKATAILANGSTFDATDVVSWSTSNDVVCSVSAAGEVMTLSEGSANVTATYANVSAACAVTVQGEIDFVVFDEVIIQPLDGSLFTVDLPVALTSYSIDGFVKQGDPVGLLFPAPRTSSTFQVATSAELTDGSIIEFTATRG